MTNITVLDSNLHRQLRVAVERDARTGADRHFVEIVPRELPLATITYPVLVTKNSDSGAFLLGAIMGFEHGENLYLEKMIAGDIYRPLQLQRDGFWIAQDQLAVDLDHPRFATGSGQSVFDAEGAPTPFLEGVAEALRELRHGGPMAATFLDTLGVLGLLAPVDIDISFDDGSHRSLEDLYSINQEALRALEDIEVLDLFRRGYLQLIYLMVASLKNIPGLARLKNSMLGALP